MEKEDRAETLIITPSRNAQNYWQDLWRFRELFYVLSWRDLKVRYKQTAVGILWAFIRPALTLLIFTLLFSRIARLPSESDLPYALMVLAGLLPWQFFANSVSEGSNSLIQNTTLITKVYFPKLIIPASTLATTFVDFMITLFLMVPLLFFLQLPARRSLIISSIIGNSLVATEFG